LGGGFNYLAGQSLELPTGAGDDSDIPRVREKPITRPGRSNDRLPCRVQLRAPVPADRIDNFLPWFQRPDQSDRHQVLVSAWI